MQYNLYRPLNSLIDWEKFSRQFKINSMQAHIKLVHNRYFSAGINFFDSFFKIWANFLLNYLAGDQLFLSVLVGGPKIQTTGKSNPDGCTANTYQRLPVRDLILYKSGYPLF